MTLYRFTAVLTPEKEAGETYYQVSVPALPEIVTFGESVEEAVFMAQDALELVVLSRLEGGETIPADKKPQKLTKGALVKEILVSVTHSVSTTPITPHVKLAFA